VGEYVRGTQTAENSAGATYNENKDKNPGRAEGAGARQGAGVVPEGDLVDLVFVPQRRAWQLARGGDPQTGRAVAAGRRHLLAVRTEPGTVHVPTVPHRLPDRPSRRHPPRSPGEPSLGYDEPGAGSAGVGFAIPSNDLKFVFYRLEKYGDVRAGMLPIRTQQVTGLMADAPFDVPHSVTLVAQKSIGLWQGGIAYRYTTGRPFTPVTVAAFNEEEKLWIPNYCAPFSERLPTLTRFGIVSRRKPKR